MRNFKAFTGLGRHLMSATFLLFLLAATTSAYSIVMQGGKRIEIPAQFNVSKTTLSYEAAPGFWITMQLATLDIPATDRANNEMPGSFLARATREQEPSRIGETKSQAREGSASRTVTNRDLESFQRSRLKSERAYEQRLKEQGLPSMADLRAQANADDKLLFQELALQRAESEAAQRDAQLQAQVAALSAQLNYLQSQSGNSSSVYPEAYPYYGGVPFFSGRSRVNSPLFRIPLGFQIGGAFGASTLPLSSPSRFRGGNIVIAPGSRTGGRGGSGGGHVRPRSR